MPFATAEDVAKRLGRTAAYEGAALDQVNTLLDLADDAILDAVDKTSAWVDDEDTMVPPALRAIAIEVVFRALLNPTGARSHSRTLGAFQESTSFRDSTGGVELTDSEERRARRAVYGTTSASAPVHAIVDDIGLPSDETGAVTT